MKRVARVLAIVGLALAAVLFARENIGRIAHLVAGAIPGLLLTASFHVVPMIANALAWQRLFPLSLRPRLRMLLKVVWIRESVNGVLPVARVGGEIAAYRVLRKHVSSRAAVAASLAADVALSVLSQSAFALLGIGMLFAAGHGGAFARELAFGVGAMVLAGAAFLLAQRIGALAGMAGVAERLFAGKLRSVRARSLRVDRALRDVHARHGDVVTCIALQFTAWVLSAGETWLALHFLGRPVAIHEAIAIEASVQAINSVAFIVPAAVGVQEGAFIVIGGVLGLDATTALALAAARRLRDLVIFLPGLVAWHRSE
jgi:glycosyltransferase 2 family protein